MKEFINSVYSSEYFVTGLFIAIAVLTVMFFVILILAIRDAKKHQMDEEEESNQPNPIASANALSQTNSQPIINPNEFVFTSEIKMPPSPMAAQPPQPAPTVSLPEVGMKANPFDLIENTVPQQTFVMPTTPAPVPSATPVVPAPMPNVMPVAPASASNVIPVANQSQEFVFPTAAPSAQPKVETVIPPAPVVPGPVPVAPMPTIEQPVPDQDPLANTARISLPDQFSSVYVEPKTDLPKRTIEFEIKQPAVDLPAPAPVVNQPAVDLPAPATPTPVAFEIKEPTINVSQLQQEALKQISESNVVASQLPKLVQDEMPLPKPLEPKENTYSAFDNIENETYQINR